MIGELVVLVLKTHWSAGASSVQGAFLIDLANPVWVSDQAMAGMSAKAIPMATYQKIQAELAQYRAQHPKAP